MMGKLLSSEIAPRKQLSQSQSTCTFTVLSIVLLSPAVRTAYAALGDL
jgi:hypothetical protein